MGRLNIVLLVVVVACALMVVSTQHRTRGLFVAHEQAMHEKLQLDVEWNQLQLDQVALAKAARVDEVARTKLKMQLPTAAQTRYLSLDTPAEAK
jgi:cell division protein FtsL